MTHHIRYRSPIQTPDRPGDELGRLIASEGEEGLLRKMAEAGMTTKKKPQLPRVLTATPKGQRPTAAVLRKRKQLLQCIREYGPMSQIEMITATGFNKSFVSSTVITLTAAGTIEEIDDGKRAWRIAGGQTQAPTHDTEQEHG